MHALDTTSNTLLEKAFRTQPLVRGLLFEDTADRRQTWGEELYRVATRVSVSAAQYDTIEAHYDALEGILSGGSDRLLADAHIFVQGSIRSRTAVLPHPNAEGDHAEVDADAVVWLPNAGDSAIETFEAVERRLRDGTRTKRDPTRKNRCVRLHYQDDSPAFHMDVTPARNGPANQSTHGDGPLLVPDLQSRGWKASAPVAYAEWFARVCDASIALDSSELQRLEERDASLAKATRDRLPDHDSYIDFNPLRAAVKLLKVHRDTMFLPAGVRDLRPISIILTTLAARAYERITNESTIAPRRSADVLIELVDRMPQFIEGEPGGRVVRNPVIDVENFAEKWQGAEGKRLETAFYDWHREACIAVRLGLWRFGSQEMLAEGTRAVFGPRAVGERDRGEIAGALDVASKASDRRSQAPAERFIEEMFPVNIEH